MVEEMETTVQHVTTFLFQRSRESEAAVYEIEAEIMKQHPATVLEFHVRAMPRNADGVPELPSGRYFLLTWQAVDKQGNY